MRGTYRPPAGFTAAVDQALAAFRPGRAETVPEHISRMLSLGTGESAGRRYVG